MIVVLRLNDNLSNVGLVGVGGGEDGGLDVPLLGRDLARAREGHRVEAGLGAVQLAVPAQLEVRVRRVGGRRRGLVRLDVGGRGLLHVLDDGLPLGVHAADGPVLLGLHGLQEELLLLLTETLLFLFLLETFPLKSLLLLLLLPPLLLLLLLLESSLELVLLLLLVLIRLAAVVVPGQVGAVPLPVAVLVVGGAVLFKGKVRLLMVVS